MYLKNQTFWSFILRKKKISKKNPGNRIDLLEGKTLKYVYNPFFLINQFQKILKFEKMEKTHKHLFEVIIIKKN